MEKDLRELEEETESDEEDEDEEEEPEEEIPPSPSPVLPPPPIPLSARPDSGKRSEINMALVRTLEKTLDLQQRRMEQIASLQERMYQDQAEVHQALRELTGDLAALAEMMKETLGSVDKHADKLVSMVAALGRLHLEQSQKA